MTQPIEVNEMEASILQVADELTAADLYPAIIGALHAGREELSVTIQRGEKQHYTLLMLNDWRAQLQQAAEQIAEQINEQMQGDE